MIITAKKNIITNEDIIMKKKIGLITEYKKAVAEYIAQIRSVFGELVTITPYNFEDDSIHNMGEETIFFVSAVSSSKFRDIKKMLPEGSVIIPAVLSLPKKSLVALNAYDKGRHAFLVNNTKKMAEETISQLYQTGYGHIAFTPYYPGCSTDEKYDLAVTAGECEYVPDYVKEIVDIGARKIDIASIIELAEALDCEYILETDRFAVFASNQVSASSGLSIILEKNLHQKRYIDTLMRVFDGGVINVDKRGIITDCNYSAADLLGVGRASLLNCDIHDIIKSPDYDRCKERQAEIKRQADDNNGFEFIMTPVIRGGEFIGAVITFTNNKPELIENKPKYVNGLAAKYNFSDIVGVSPRIVSTVALAKKMARTDSNVLITGESGTGKELFAHSVHNNSERAEGPFVAINCAALPENLLESELFGYEEGAFTGARKGGKTGLFELADSGTIFLDEIEGMSLSTQVKLLRVVQEREIMRLSGEKIIDINVRIISASNQNLMQLIEQGKFRKDLFYRLNTLPLNIPSLSERKEDIPLLLETFKGRLNLTFVFTEEAKKYLKDYSWPGNIREMQNCIEYLACLDLSVVDIKDLPEIMLTDGVHRNSVEDIYSKIIMILAEMHCGRQQLMEELNKRGVRITEGRLRSVMQKMQTDGLIKSGKGRQGSEATKLGLEYIKNRQE